MASLEAVGGGASLAKPSLAMTPLDVTLADRKTLGFVPGLIWLFLVFVGCGGRSANDKGAGDNESPGGGGADAEAHGGAAAGGARGGTLGNAGGSGKRPTGAGGVGGSPTDGAGGSAAASGDFGIAGAAGADGNACVNVFGGGIEPWYDLTIFGTGFGADEGKHMRIAVASQSPYRVGIADLPIVDGAFSLSMPGVLNARRYVGITLYVDRNNNDTCETDEHAWDWTTRTVIGNMRFDVTPDQMCDETLMNCGPPDPTQVCAVGTGDTNLMRPLPCIRQ